MQDKTINLKKGTGSKPTKGNISDNQLSLILNIPKSTLRDWKKSNSFRKELYWTLKAIKKEELMNFKKESEKFIDW